MASNERNLRVDGLTTRYLEQGDGSAVVVMMHGAAVGSSANVWEDHLGPLAARGLRVIAYDRPGFGRTEDPPDASAAYQQRFVLALMDALGIERAGLVGHSMAGNIAVNLALESPERVSAVMVLGTGSLLPPVEGAPPASPAPNESVFGREPTRDDIRHVLEEQLYNHGLITPELVESRYQLSLGHVRERPAAAPTPANRPPMWPRLGQIKQPLMLLYGKDDRPTTAAQVELLRQHYPSMDVRLIDHCKHLIQLDAADTFFAAAVELFGTPALA
jgi:pimeloyl-ACP methyl ester carboxylesterase